MRKIFINVGAILLAVFLTSAVAFALQTVAPRYKKPSDYKLGISYEKALKSEKPMLALFYADWCGYCMRFMPKYQAISRKYSGKYNIVMLDVEAPANKELIEQVAITGFPTLYIIDPKYDNVVLLNNAIYHVDKKMDTELERYLRIRKILDSADNK